MVVTERDVWLSFGVETEGISVTAYAQAADQEPTVVDEVWYTWSELAEMDHTPIDVDDLDDYQ